ncbi:hypothetical protein [Streptococcus mutans]|uniref:hypothetical protein n=1 Tax=Streptococcus mutans TaxID=1309 RepID=UPI0002B51B42|nr:hypothetical protein [Streptococcus mutans]EMB76034.1 hypothetical protein SMU41_04846 [Streptococcus mutans 2VS1]
MRFKRFGRDYALSGDNVFEVLTASCDVIERNLSYREMCGLMQRELEKAVDKELLDKSTAFDVIGDIPAYNELVDDIERLLKESL